MKISAGSMVLMLCVLCATPSIAEEPNEGQAEKRPRVELSLRSWMFTNGETKWSHNASGLSPNLGNPTSKLTYKDNNTQIIELSGKVNLQRRWFVRGDLGFSVDFDRGVLVDDDYTAVGGQHLFSRTNSDISGHGTWYVNLDVGRRVVEYAGNRGYLDLFGGFQYWRTKYEARGVSQVVCNPSGVPGLTCSPPGTVLFPGVLAVTNTTHWITPLRAGAQTEYRLTRRLSLEGKLAVTPLSIVFNEDNHNIRSSGQFQAPDLQNPSFTMWGLGASVNADASVKVMLTKNVALTGGYRIMWNRTYTGMWENHPLGASSQTAPLTEFQTFRHGAVVGLTAFF